MYEKLCSSLGEERLKMVAELKLVDIEYICHRVKHCRDCPLALHFVDQSGIPRICCLDIATTTKIRKIMNDGGYFIATKGI